MRYTLILLAISGLLIGFLGQRVYDHECHEHQAFSREALKSHLTIHGEVSEGIWITAGDSKLWTICSAVCDPSYFETMEAGDPYE